MQRKEAIWQWWLILVKYPDTRKKWKTRKWERERAVLFERHSYQPCLLLKWQKAASRRQWTQTSRSKTLQGKKNERNRQIWCQWKSQIGEGKQQTPLRWTTTKTIAKQKLWASGPHLQGQKHPSSLTYLATEKSKAFIWMSVNKLRRKIKKQWMIFEAQNPIHEREDRGSFTRKQILLQNWFSVCECQIKVNTKKQEMKSGKEEVRKHRQKVNPSKL